MCTGSKAPAPPPRVPEAAQAPTAPSRRTSESDVARRRAASGTGGRSTILTSSRGVQDGGGATAQKTLLGQ